MKIAMLTVEPRTIGFWQILEGDTYASTRTTKNCNLTSDSLSNNAPVNLAQTNSRKALVTIAKQRGTSAPLVMQLPTHKQLRDGQFQYL
jgi:hypothetical protein